MLARRARIDTGALFPAKIGARPAGPTAASSRTHRSQPATSSNDRNSSELGGTALVVLRPPEQELHEVPVFRPGDDVDVVARGEHGVLLGRDQVVAADDE